ncbi:MAG: ABC-F family ATP-binding cassette domain-containing protein [Anaerolineae bacterium]
MHIIHIHHLTLNHAGREIFNDLTWAIGDRDKVGFVGPNGAGKSSLFKALVGLIPPEAGSIVRQNGITLGYLPQEVMLPPGETLIETALVPPPRIAEIEATMTALETALGDPDVYEDADRLQETLDALDTATRLYDQLGGAAYPNRLKSLLNAFGFTSADFDLPTATLSGGQRKLVALARLAVEQPDVLLLDEPDNHLDLSAKRSLEIFIRDYKGAVVIISHDRYLLDETVTQIVELENGQLSVYPGNYSAYAHERELRRLRQEQQYLAQQKEIARIEEMIKRFEMLAKVFEDERANRQARSRRKMLERMEANGEMIDKVYQQRTMQLQLEGGRGSTNALALKGVTMGFDDDLIFLDLDLLVRHGERVGLIGPNGAGKSVLFRLVLGQLTPLEGQVIIGPSTRVGYYAQEHQTLSEWAKRTPIDLVRDIKPMAEGAAVTQLLKFAFTYAQTRQPIGTFSGGERSRLQLLALMLQAPNLLLLDEPTNNLDIASTEVLEAALEEFEGAVLTISHDRYFLDRVVDRVVELRDGTLTSYLGGYTEYLQRQGAL